MASPSWADYLTTGLVGIPGGVNPVPTKTPEQISAQNAILSGGMAALQNPYQDFQPIAQQARTQFEQQTVPGLAERFTAMGGYGTGALSSPAFAGQLASGGAQLESNLAAMQAQHGLQARDQALRQLSLGLEPQFQNVSTPGQPGLLDSAGNIIYPLASYAGQKAGMSAIDSLFNKPVNQQIAQDAGQQAASSGIDALKAGTTAAAAGGAGALAGKGAAGLIAGFAALPVAAKLGVLAAAAAAGYLVYRGGKWVWNKFKGNK